MQNNRTCTRRVILPRSSGRAQVLTLLSRLSDAYEGRAKVVRVNVDHQRDLAVKYHVRNIPYLLSFKEGNKVAEQVGAIGTAQLAGMIDKALA